MTGIDERQAFAKLEALKDIRNKTINLEKTRVGLLCDVDQLEEEEKCLSEYRRELELLQQEKMAHVEELRQIHADINALESIIKQAEESRKGAQVNTMFDTLTMMMMMLILMMVLRMKPLRLIMLDQACLSTRCYHQLNSRPHQLRFTI